MSRAIQVSQPIKLPHTSKLLNSESRCSRSPLFLFNSSSPIFKLGFVSSNNLKIRTFSTVRDGLDSSALGLLELISNETQFDRVIAEAHQLEESVVILWMASWCRKCIYLKPKLERLAADYHPRVRFYCIDVNNVPHKLVVRAGVTKMPTVQLWMDSKKQGEVIGGHQAHVVVNEVREMIECGNTM